MCGTARPLRIMDGKCMAFDCAFQLCTCVPRVRIVSKSKVWKRRAGVGFDTARADLLRSGAVLSCAPTRSQLHRGDQYGLLSADRSTPSMIMGCHA